ncbi:MAG TPA: shikimate kinase [Gemmatimonadaceae bacterium]|nr:shikimate kinase [Gemmatimonadaceae bacterium]
MATFRTSQAVSAADPSVPHLILVGLPGSGKSSVGRAVAADLGRNFLDIDVEIERREGITIAEIFGARGEGYFRSLERRVSDELRDTGGFVVATGGGWIANPGCLEAVRPPARVVYLQVEPERALKRMAAAASQRPLLRRPDPLAELVRLLAERENRYLLADHTVRVDFLREKEVVANIVALARGGGQD